ncbi:MAB_1171c family putative transporter [Catenulispora sp. GAS73]|uniref:MAB_1171c family putative transporter n=1 Tax=Catenulispora sp. GAS73 TaxID=3156269 RepID=UPI0035120299
MALFMITAVCSYAAFVYKASHARRGWRDAVYRTLMATLFLQCLTFTMGAVATGSPNLLGVGNSAILVMHLAAVAYCVGAEILLLQWAEPLPAIRSGIRNWVFFGLGTDVLLVLLFFVSGAPHKPAAALTTGSKDLLLLAYLVVFIVSQTIPCVTIFRACLSYAKLTDKIWLRRALRFLTVGSVLLFMYCVTRTINMIGAAAGANVNGLKIVPAVFSGLGIIVVSIGLTMPSWGPRLSDLGQWIENILSYRALYPLWNAVCQESPEIVLEPRNSGVSNLHYRLHRRVVEIRDGWRALRPYMDVAEVADVADVAEQPDAGTANGAAPGPNNDQALAEAVRIRDAIRAKRDGHAPDSERRRPGFEERDATTLADEVSWLAKVSSAYAKLPSFDAARGSWNGMSQGRALENSES